jgi:hypothetical protein
VQSIHHCGDTYKVATADGKVRDFWERNLRFKTDVSDDGPQKGAPALVGAKPHLAGVREYGGTVAFDMFVEAQAEASFGQHASQRGLADLQRITPQVVAIEFDECVLPTKFST